jgi:hypothetical protein
MSTKTATIDRIIAEASQVVEIDSIKPYHKNPRVGNVDAIRDSLRQNGQYQPLRVQKSTGEILGGNHTWKAAKAEGWTKILVVFLDVDDEAAKRIVLADNRTNDLATYDTDILADILAGLPDPQIGTGFTDSDVSDLLGAIKQSNDQMVDSVLRPPTLPPPSDTGEIGPEGDNSMGGPNLGGADAGAYTGPQDDADDIETLDDQLGELQGILQLNENVQFPGNNYYTIPDLRTDMLVDVLPDPLDTWGGHDATPDDGVTTWVWNYGVASKKDLPMDRAILCFYTYDTYFESFWENPAFMTAKVMNAGIKMAVVPDFSYYSDTSVAMWVFNQYRAQWIGRFFQEAGIKVIPRIQFAIDKLDSVSLDFNTLGIPKNAPVVAKCSHNANTKEEFDLDVYGLQKSLEKIEPKQLLMYGGNPALRIIETLDPVAKGLVDEVVHVYNYAAKRRGIVFDKKEGLAARNKNKKRLQRDQAVATNGSRTAPEVAVEEPADEPETEL